MPATLSPEATISSLVTEKPARSRVFEALRIDYCCAGKRTLAQACAAKSLDPASVIELLALADNQPTPALNPDTLSLTQLADHIEQEHHAFLRSELPRLDQMTEKVARVHADSDPRLHDVRRAFCALRDELSAHMIKEEQILFPMVRQLDTATTLPHFHCGTLANPIRQMEAEHDNAGAALATMRAATDNYQPPDWACNTYRAMLDGLANLEADMHQHVHKENNILFTKALQREASFPPNHH